MDPRDAELDRLRAENERLTRERDEARAEALTSIETRLRNENARLRSALTASEARERGMREALTKACEFLALHGTRRRACDTERDYADLCSCGLVGAINTARSALSSGADAAAKEGE
jgi:hypothetical protein